MSVDRVMAKISTSPFFWWSSGFVGGMGVMAVAWWAS